jgi:hypothetical protein
VVACAVAGATNIVAGRVNAAGTVQYTTLATGLAAVPALGYGFVAGPDPTVTPPANAPVVAPGSGIPDVVAAVTGGGVVVYPGDGSSSQQVHATDAIDVTVGDVDGMGSRCSIVACSLP